MDAPAYFRADEKLRRCDIWKPAADICHRGCRGLHGKRRGLGHCRHHRLHGDAGDDGRDGRCVECRASYGYGHQVNANRRVRGHPRWRSGCGNVQPLLPDLAASLPWFLCRQALCTDRHSACSNHPWRAAIRDLAACPACHQRVFALGGGQRPAYGSDRLWFC